MLLRADEAGVTMKSGSDDPARNRLHALETLVYGEKVLDNNIFNGFLNSFVLKNKITSFCFTNDDLYYHSRNTSICCMSTQACVVGVRVTDHS